MTTVQPTEADREKAADLLDSAHSGWCGAASDHPSPGPCICRLKGKADAIAAALATAREEGRASVGLADFMPGGCDAEKAAPNWHFVETYGDWLDCTRRKGHDGDHEHEDSGLTWPRDDKEPRP